MGLPPPPGFGPAHNKPMNVNANMVSAPLNPMVVNSASVVTVSNPMAVHHGGMGVVNTSYSLWGLQQQHNSNGNDSSYNSNGNDSSYNSNGNDYNSALTVT